MLIQFEKLRLQGFKCFTTPQELDLKTGPGLYFICGQNKVEPRLGSNGSGKSSVLDALCWCLFGRTIGGLRNPDIQPRQGSQPTQVSIACQIEGKPYRIVRTTSPNTLTINKEEAGQDRLDKLLQLDASVFAHTILIGQGRPLFFDLSPRDKMQLFSEVLHLDRWEDRSTLASNRTNQLLQQQTEEQGQLTALINTQEEVQKLLTGLRDHSTQWEAERVKGVAAYEKELKELEGALEPCQVKHDKANLAYDGAMTELKSVQREIDKLQPLLLNAKLAENRALLELQHQEKQLAKLQQELKSLSQADKCPTCGQPIKRANMNQHKEELTQQIAQTKKAVEAGVPLPIKNTVIMFEGKLADARKYAEVFRVRCEAGEVELNMITPRLVELQTKIKGVKKIIQERENQQNPYREQIQTLRRKKSQLEAEQAQLETQLQKISRRIERHKFWIKGFKDVRLFIIEEILQELELATNAMLGEVGLLDWWVQYDIEKETKSGTTQRGINVVILSPSNKQAVRWETWSGGEGQRLRLISALALSEVLLSHAGVQTNLEMLDEPTSHLSTEGVQDLCEFLAQRARQTGKQIYYIDHTAVESTHFDRVLTVTKDKHGSTLSWEAT